MKRVSLKEYSKANLRQMDSRVRARYTGAVVLYVIGMFGFIWLCYKRHWNEHLWYFLTFLFIAVLAPQAIRYYYTCVNAEVKAKKTDSQRTTAKKR